MGKQSRRKRQRNNKQSKQQSTDAAATDNSTVLQRLRHADPRTRHAALAALAATILNPEELAEKKGKISPSLLAAIRERVMDSDLECAQAAAGCLANYVLFAPSQDEETTASWTVVLVQRLNDCRQALTAVAVQDGTNVKQRNKNLKQWWAVSLQCLHALCGLVETNELALERLSPSHRMMPHDSVGILLGLLECCQKELPPECSDISQKVAIYATRTLHSALDDNLELYQGWPNGGWKFLQQVCVNDKLFMSARLHAAGCLVTSGSLQDTLSSAHQQVVVDTVLPLLNSCLDFSIPHNKALLESYLDCLAQYEKEQQDDAVEREVIRNVNNRKEPAREIARRQKAMKDIEDEKQKEVDEAMKDDDNDEEKEDRREALASALEAWHASIVPLQLALEITANLTSGGSIQAGMESSDDDGTLPMDEDGIQWGPDQEAQLMAQCAQQQQASAAMQFSCTDAASVQAVAQSGLPSRLVTLLQAVCTPLVANKEIPTDIQQEWADVQSKCGASLGNCLAEHFASWGDEQVWKELRSMLEATGGKNEAIARTMTVALESRSIVRKHVQPDDLDFLLQLTSQESSIQRYTVEMLGILCSRETHPIEVNHKVCLVLLNLPTNKADLVHQVLNALMDMYGDDDEAHASVFDSLNVLSYFQRTIPHFKKLIQSQRGKASDDELERWKETALNASRFVQYKKGQL